MLNAFRFQDYVSIIGRALLVVKILLQTCLAYYNIDHKIFCLWKTNSTSFSIIINKKIIWFHLEYLEISHPLDSFGYESMKIYTRNCLTPVSI